MRQGIEIIVFLIAKIVPERAVLLYALALSFLIVPNSVTYAQAWDVHPEPSVRLFEHGYNSFGVFTARENIDSVSIGGTTKYYILPDPLVNAGFDSTFSLFANVTSTFAWVLTGSASGTIDSVDVSGTKYGHYQQITWTGLGLGSIDVTETSAAPASLTGSTLETAVEVIAAPNVTAIADMANISCFAGSLPYSIMYNNNALLSVDCSILPTDTFGLEVTYSLYGPGAFADIVSATAAVSNAGVLDLSAIELTYPGAYTLTIINVSDRISRKSALPPVAVGLSKNFYVTPLPVSAPLKHVTNEGW